MTDLADPKDRAKALVDIAEQLLKTHPAEAPIADIMVCIEDDATGLIDVASALETAMRQLHPDGKSDIQVERAGDKIFIRSPHEVALLMVETLLMGAGVRFKRRPPQGKVAEHNSSKGTSTPKLTEHVKKNLDAVKDKPESMVNYTGDPRVKAFDNVGPEDHTKTPKQQKLSISLGEAIEQALSKKPMTAKQVMQAVKWDGDPSVVQRMLDGMVKHNKATVESGAYTLKQAKLSNREKAARLVRMARALMLEEEPIFKPTGRFFGASCNQRTAAKSGSRKNVFVQYIDTGNSFKPAPNISLAPKLAAGIYTIVPTMEGYVFESNELNTDALLRFDDPIHNEILGEMKDFWRQRDAYEKRGFLHRRAALMFGPPGSGKSCIVKTAIDDLTKAGDVVFNCKSVHDLREGLKLFREVEPGRRCLAIMEDVDELSEHSLLQLLDGTDSANNILYLATTNYIHRLPERALRPGRFDRKIEVPHPPPAGRRAFLASKLQPDEISPEGLEQLVAATEGFSFGHLRELVTAAYCMMQPLDVVLDRLKGNTIEEAKKYAKGKAKVAALLEGKK